MKRVQEKQLAISILTPCTLRCRLCTALTPFYDEKKCHYIASFRQLQREITALFDVYDFINDMTITGGEPLLHRELPEITAFLLREFSDRFQMLRIFSNGTVLPNPRLMKVLTENVRDKFEFVIDHYGEFSPKAEETVELLERSRIKYRINQYYGGSQHCGGWVDCGPIDKYRNYSPQEIEELVHHCHYATWKCLLLFKGKVHLCSLAACGEDLGYFRLKPGEYVDLLDPATSLEEKRRTAASLGDTAVTACQYCDGFDVERSKRYPAGEQL